MTPKAIDIFSGCGGLTLGLTQAGFNVAGAVEIDPLAAKTYQINHPDVKLWRKDIRQVTAPQILQALKMKKGDLDLLAGCPPCQGFSRMRRLNGGRRIRDDRNDLVFEFLRLVKGLRPKTVMMENVPGLAKDARLKKVKLELERLGYVVNAQVEDASQYGVPQRRFRFILLAGFHREIRVAQRSQRILTVRDAFSKLDKRRAQKDILHNLPENRSEKIVKLIQLIPKDGGSRLDLGDEWQLACHLKCNGFKDVYGRMKWDDVSPTITGGCFNPSKGRFLHPEENRAISLREAALLQSFPPDYYFALDRGKCSVAQMIGNALPPEFIRRHAIELVRAVEIIAKEQTGET